MQGTLLLSILAVGAFVVLPQVIGEGGSRISIYGVHEAATGTSQDLAAYPNAFEKADWIPTDPDELFGPATGSEGRPR